MQSYEYKVVPAPVRGEKERGAKTAPERFGVAMTNLLNTMAREGWEYQRSDTLPCEERVGFTGRATNFQHMLVFRRTLAAGEAAPAPLALVAPVEPAQPRVGVPDALPGAAPALGPARPELAAE